MKTLLNTYCVIETEEHVKALGEHQSWVNHGFIGDAIAYGEQRGDHDFDAFDPEDLPHRTRVTVEQYIDLLNDRITPWRLEEVGFNLHGNEPYTYHSLDVSDTFSLGAGTDGVWLRGSHLPAVTTFSELQTLIKFLTPKP